MLSEQINNKAKRNQSEDYSQHAQGTFELAIRRGNLTMKRHGFMKLYRRTGKSLIVDLERIRP